MKRFHRPARETRLRMTRRQFLTAAATTAAGIAASIASRSGADETPGRLGRLASVATGNVGDLLPGFGPHAFGGTAVLAAENDPFENEIGWAYTCDNSITPEQMLTDMQRMRDLGCTAIYIGHDNPARAGWGSAEPGLSFAVWYEIETNGPEASAAQEKLAAVILGIETARKVGLHVVLPIDYQIMPGRHWSQRNPGELAIGPDGAPLESHGDSIASPYSERFRAHKREYYDWVQARLLSVYPHIAAINLGDEPIGCDYSAHAMATFEQRFGIPWQDASSWQRGDFQAGVIADYAIWAAWQWNLINPTIRAMFTLHIERGRPFFPCYERIYRQTPANFVISADTHLHDAPGWVPLTPQDGNLLHNLVRQLGLWSMSSGKDVMPWHSVNHWGLNTGGIPEALDNYAIVVNQMKNAGGRIAMTMAWGWNIRWQGLFRDEGSFAHVDKEAMLAAISTAMADARPILSERREPHEHTILYFPSRQLYQLLDANRPAFSFEQKPWFDIQSVDFTHQRSVALTDGPALEEAHRRGWPIVQVGGSSAIEPTESINYLPRDVREVHQGTLWYGATTYAATQAVARLRTIYEARGLDWLREVGLYKGSIFANGQHGRYYEYVIFERDVFHAVGDRFESTLVFRDLANGKLELGEGNRRFLPFPEPVLERLSATPIVGDSGSLAPSFMTLRPFLSLNGEILDENRTGDVANESVTVDGTTGTYTGSSVEEIRFAAFDNWHNIPNVLYNEIIRRYGAEIGDWWPRIGRPIGRALWVESMIGSEGLRWILTQPFERGILTYHPHYTDQPEYLVQRALVGNLLLRLLTGSDEPYQV